MGPKRYTGRKSIDPVIMIKMLLIGYLYGLKSERRLEEEISLKLAYRWFCDLDLAQRVPDHSTFSQNRRRRFKDNTLFRTVFNEIVIQCINSSVVGGETVVADGSFLHANITLKSTVEVIGTIQQSSIHYLNELEKEMSERPGYQPPVTKEVVKRNLKSSTDPDCGYINQKNKKGLIRLSHFSSQSINRNHVMDLYSIRKICRPYNYALSIQCMGCYNTVRNENMANNA